MNCMYCDSENVKVIDSRYHNDLKCTSRIRRCYDCGETFPTYEVPGKVKMKNGKGVSLESLNVSRGTTT